MMWVFVLYLAILVAIGAITQVRTRGIQGFVLGDRATGPLATALSYESTAYSGWLMLGFPGRAFARGLAAIWVGVACVIGDALTWLSIARRLRHQTALLGALTVPEYLEKRFPKQNGVAVRAVAGAAVMGFMLVYLWSQFVASGKSLSEVLSLDYRFAVLLSSSVMVLYTLQGGYRAVVWTDAFQGVMMFVALVLLPAACLHQLGGFLGLFDVLRSASAEALAGPEPALAARGGHLAELFAGLSGTALFLFLLEDAGVGLGFIGQPHTCVRYMAIADSRALRLSMVISIAWAMVVCTGAVLVGLTAHGWFTPAGLAAAGDRVPLDDPEKALPRLAAAVLPDWLAGLVVSAILAAIMSSAASFLLSAASSMSRDVYHKLLRPTANDRELLLISRLMTFSLGTVALGLAFTTDPKDKNATVYSLVVYGWGGLAGAFGMPLLLALYHRGMTRAGCLAGMLSGVATTLLWRNGVAALDESLLDKEIVPAMAISGLAVLLVSALTRPPKGLPEELFVTPGRGEST